SCRVWSAGMPCAARDPHNLTLRANYSVVTQVCVPKESPAVPWNYGGEGTTMPLLRILRPTLPILIGASIMLTLSMGLRQSLGIFMQPLTHGIGISVSDFTLALAVQNLAWGFLQPLAGAMTVRYGFRPIMLVGSLFYIAGLALMASANGLLSVLIGGGVLIGTSLACTAAAIAMSVAARSVPETVRSTVLGIVSAAGSLGALLSAPIGQLL